MNYLFGDWLKNYNDSLFIHSVSGGKAQPISLAILRIFLGFFCQLHEHLSQNLGANCHFEGLNVSKSQLDQKLQYKIQIIQFFFQFCKKKN